MSRPRQSPEQRFWAKVDKRAPNGCWQWTGALKRLDRYGQFWMGGPSMTPIYAHRAVFHFLGIEIPEGKVVDHICRNRGCVNPRHLRFVTNEVNTRENSLSPFAQHRHKVACVHGHPFTPKNTAIKTMYHPSGKKALTRFCIACNPSLWRWAMVKIDPPPSKFPRKGVWVGPMTMDDGRPDRKPRKPKKGYGYTGRGSKGHSRVRGARHA